MCHIVVTSFVELACFVMCCSCVQYVNMCKVGLHSSWFVWETSGVLPALLDSVRGSSSHKHAAEQVASNRWHGWRDERQTQDEML